MPANEPSVSKGAELPAFLAIEFLADVAAEDPDKGQEAAEVSFSALSICIVPGRMRC